MEGCELNSGGPGYGKLKGYIARRNKPVAFSNVGHIVIK